MNDDKVTFVQLARLAARGVEPTASLISSVLADAASHVERLGGALHPDPAAVSQSADDVDADVLRVLAMAERLDARFTSVLRDIRERAAAGDTSSPPIEWSMHTAGAVVLACAALMEKS